MTPEEMKEELELRFQHYDRLMELAELRRLMNERYERQIAHPWTEPPRAPARRFWRRLAGGRRE